MLIAGLSHVNRLRRRHVLEKAIPACGLIVLTILQTSPPPPLGLLLAATLAAVGLAGVPIGIWARLLLAPTAFILAGTLALAFESAPGFPWLTWSESGARPAGLIAVRALAATAWMLFLAVTTPVTDLAAGVRRLPGGALFAELILFMHGLIFVLLDTAASMTLAQKSRLGYATAGNARRSLGLLAANLFERSMQRAGRLEIGLAARGFDGELRLLSATLPLSRTVLVCEVLGLVALYVLCGLGGCFGV